ncbi:MAG TPA: SprT family zinc-dependent metalloprotease [Gammaproteobacteria bacterium]
MDAQLQLWGGNTAPVADAGVAFEVRESTKARRLILQVVPPRTVEVVVPHGMRPAIVQEFIEAHKDWIRRAERELIQAYPIVDLRPAQVELVATGERFDVHYARAANGTASYRQRDRELRLYCARGDHTDAPNLLRRWLLRQAREQLKPWLEREAEIAGLMPRSIQVRLQKTRWGSCSSAGNISLNAALMLVAPELVRYLLIHELVHLKHLSHSRRYWKAVAGYEPDYRRLDRQLAACWARMPSWLQCSA